LSTIKDGSLEWVLFLLQVGFCSFSGREQVLQYDR
jgi:hypothetical protein